MKTACIVMLLASSGLFSACAYVPPIQAASRLVSQDYTASGKVSDVRAYVYGERTILEVHSAPIFLSIRDSTGASVPYEKIGRYYRLARYLDTFTAWINGQSVTFSAVTVTRIFSAPLAVSVTTKDKKF